MKVRRTAKKEGICDECKADCIALACGTNKVASEWYCGPCHKSYKMSMTNADRILSIEAERMPRRG